MTNPSTPSSGVTEGKAESGPCPKCAQRCATCAHDFDWHNIKGQCCAMEMRGSGYVGAETCDCRAFVAQPPAPADEGKAESGEQVAALRAVVDWSGVAHQLARQPVVYDAEIEQAAPSTGGWRGATPEETERIVRVVTSQARPAQPAAPADDTAEVLAGLVDEIENLRQKYLRYSEYSQEYGHDSGHRAEGVRDALLLVRAAQQRLTAPGAPGQANETEERERG